MIDPQTIEAGQRKATREFLIKKAKEFLGKPYKLGAKPEEAPGCFDCSSFIQYVYKWIGVHLPRTTNLQSKLGRLARSRRPRKGDLIFFRGARPWEVTINGITCWIGHVGMYIGRNEFIHCSQKKGVAVKSLKETKYSIILIRRII